MKAISIFNHVLGPVMRGPSSSHTAGAFHIGSMARSLLGGTPMKAVLTFDPDGSYAATYVTQGADRGFAMGLLGKPLTDDSFFTVLDAAPAAGMQLEFRTEPLPGADHPNTTDLDLTEAGGRSLKLVARSVGGGAVEITRIDGRPVLFDGTSHEVLVEVPADRAGVARDLLGDDGKLLEAPEPANGDGVVRWTAKRKEALAVKSRRKLELLDSQAVPPKNSVRLTLQRLAPFGKTGTLRQDDRVFKPAKIQSWRFCGGRGKTASPLNPAKDRLENLYTGLDLACCLTET